MTIERRSNEAEAIQCDVDETSTTSAPTVAGGRPSNAVQVPDSKRMRTRCHLRVRKTIATGTNTLQIIVWARQTCGFAQSAPSTPVAADEEWFKIFDTGALSDSGNIRESWLLQGAQDYEDLVTEVVANGGGTPSLDSWFAFAGTE